MLELLKTFPNFRATGHHTGASKKEHKNNERYDSNKIQEQIALAKETFFGFCSRFFLFVLFVDQLFNCRQLFLDVKKSLVIDSLNCTAVINIARR